MSSVGRRDGRYFKQEQSNVIIGCIAIREDSTIIIWTADAMQYDHLKSSLTLLYCTILALMKIGKTEWWEQAYPKILCSIISFILVFPSKSVVYLTHHWNVLLTQKTPWVRATNGNHHHQSGKQVSAKVGRFPFFFVEYHGNYCAHSSKYFYKMRSNLSTTITLGKWQGHRYIQGDRCIQVNFEKNIRQLKILGSWPVTVKYRMTAIYRAVIYSRFDCSLVLSVFSSSKINA